MVPSVNYLGESNNDKINVRFYPIFVSQDPSSRMQILFAFLYRDDYYERAGEEEGMPNNKVEVIIEKTVRVRVEQWS